MTISNLQYHNIPFEDYLNIPGISYSGTKEKVFISTPGMSLGTRIHNYILEPEKYDWQDVAEVKAISAALRTCLGPALQHLQKEVGFTAEFEHNGLTMVYKGRTDLALFGKIIIDLKILAGPLAPAVQYFGYDKQLSGYCLATNTPKAIIIAYNKKNKKTELQTITPCARFWEYQVASRGEVKF